MAYQAFHCCPRHFQNIFRRKNCRWRNILASNCFANKIYTRYESIKIIWLYHRSSEHWWLSRAPNEVKSWKETQTTWDFDRIITSQFASPISATPENFRSAHLFLVEEKSIDSSIKCLDWNLLDSINHFVAKTNAGAHVIHDFLMVVLVDPVIIPRYFY